MKKTWDSDTSLGTAILGWISAIILILGATFGLLCLESWLVMLLWNATLPAIFGGVTAIGFWQSVGINLLATMLFGGVGRTISALANND